MLDDFLTGQPPAAVLFANDNRAPGRGSAPIGTAGLALCCESDAAGAPFATIRPVFLDGTLGEPLLGLRDGSDIIALWRGLGQQMRLPLFAQLPDGTLEAFGLSTGGPAHARRGGSPLSGRRPRFARKRAVPLAARHLATDGPIRGARP